MCYDQLSVISDQLSIIIFSLSIIKVTIADHQSSLSNHKQTNCPCRTLKNRFDRAAVQFLFR